MTNRICPTCSGPKDWRQAFCCEACRPVCGHPGCDRLVRTRGLCASHYGDLWTYEKTGQVRRYRWAGEKRCVVCGSTEWVGKGRKVCSGRCQQLLARNGGLPPSLVKQCARCTAFIDLSARHPSGRKTRADIKICRACWRSKYTRHRFSVTELADRDGTDCGVCGEAIDMTLTFPDLFRPSVDHVLPFASGGSHDPSNLQLAHLWCNYVKQNRPGFVM